MSRYISVMNNPNVYLSEAALETIAEGDVKVYYYIRLIGSIDQYIVDKNYKNDDYMRVKKQQIENMTKADLIKDINPFNSKNWPDYLLFAIYIPLNHFLLSFFNQSNQSICIFIYFHL